MSAGLARERREVHYWGYVQGVGFRYTVQRIARRHEVVGFVRNLSDGRVQLVAEGVSGELDRFLGRIAEAMGGYIDRADVEESPATNEYLGFDIRF